MIRSSVLAVMVAAAAAGSEAGHRRCHSPQPIVLAQPFVTVPFAVPVGVPVAPWGGVYYSYASAAAGASGAQATGGAAAPSSAPSCPAPGAAPAEPQPILPQATAPTEPPGAVVLRTRCARCHSGEAAKGDLRLFDPAGAAAGGSGWAPGWRTHARGIFDALRAGQMPKGGPALSDQEFTDVVEFLLTSEPGQVAGPEPLSEAEEQ